ncbi:hypothetical protein SS50377_23924 [Spironucleus salmonicida]|uniref:Uncharacterized protein n=2 Tax=Spironucleus salmonicida TaxID=348837 RepID=A0A9P8LSX9_9EUKA|nr:hypothetical protein SS50377_23924 [Spironucleus salmonicida]
MQRLYKVSEQRHTGLIYNFIIFIQKIYYEAHYIQQIYENITLFVEQSCQFCNILSQEVNLKMGIQVSKLENNVVNQLRQQQPLLTYDISSLQPNIENQQPQFSFIRQPIYNNSTSFQNQSESKLPNGFKLISPRNKQWLLNNNSAGSEKVSYYTFIETETEARNQELYQSADRLSRILTLICDNNNGQIIQ